MRVKDSVAFVTGANRGLGLAFAKALLAGGAKVYAAARDREAIALPGVTKVRLDVTNPARRSPPPRARRAMSICSSTTPGSPTAPLSSARTPSPPRARNWRPIISARFCSAAPSPRCSPRNGGGAILNVLSVLSWVNLPNFATYSASKAAAWSLTNGLRNELAAQGTQVAGPARRLHGHRHGEPHRRPEIAPRGRRQSRRWKRWRRAARKSSPTSSPATSRRACRPTRPSTSACPAADRAARQLSHGAAARRIDAVFRRCAAATAARSMLTALAPARPARRRRCSLAVDLEERAQRRAGIAAPEAVGSERHERRAQIGGDELRIGAHIIRGRDDRRVPGKPRGDAARRRRARADSSRLRRSTSRASRASSE